MTELAHPEMFEITVSSPPIGGGNAVEEDPRPAARPFVAETRPTQMTLALEGEIGIREYDEIADQLFRFSSRGVRRVVIDFTDVSHADYRIVRPLMMRAAGLRHLGGDLKLCGLSPYLHAIFRSAGAHDAFDYFAEPEDAVKSFERAVLVSG